MSATTGPLRHTMAYVRRRPDCGPAITKQSGGPTSLIVESGHALGNPALEGCADGLPARLRVLCDRFDIPALDVQAHDGQAARGGGGSSARMRRTVAVLGRCPHCTQQMVRSSLTLSGGCSRFASRIARRAGTASVRCFSTFGGGTRLGMANARRAPPAE